jgi:transcriptional regulator with XRE-family HTH domain/Na+-transporting methylmalonyl-CoA/oxaloacetate decarboxylase gamma subunit
MQTLGERLEEARKRKGISVREAAEATKIRGDYLQKFEANSFDFDLPPLYIRGFLRTYAKFLDLDPQRLVAEFDTLMVDEGRAPRRDTRENYGRVDFGGESSEAAPATLRPPGGHAGSGSAGLDPVMLKYLIFGGGAVVLLLIVLIVVNLFSGSSEERQVARPPAADSTQATTAPKQPALLEANTTAQTVTFTALDNSRVKIVRVADESVVFDGALTRGETRSFRKSGVWRVTVEDRTKLRLEVNGRAMDIPPLQAGNYGRFTLD